MTIRRGCLPFALLLLVVSLAISTQVRAQVTSPMCVVASPEAEATPAARSVVPDTNLAFLALMYHLVSDTAAITELAEGYLADPDLITISDREAARAQQDLLVLQEFGAPTTTGNIYLYLNVLIPHMAELGLPANEGGEESFGASTWIANLCIAKTPFDAVYVSALSDLSHQKLQLAEVAAVFADSEGIRTWATEIIERETTTQAELFALA